MGSRTSAGSDVYMGRQERLDQGEEEETCRSDDGGGREEEEDGR